MGEAKAERWTRKNLRVRSSLESEADQVSGVRSGRACLCAAGASDPLLERGRRGSEGERGQKTEDKERNSKRKREVGKRSCRSGRDQEDHSSGVWPFLCAGTALGASWIQSVDGELGLAKEDCGLPRGGTLKTSEQRDTI